MLGQDETVRTPKEYFMTDMFAVKRSTFVDRDDARLIQVAQAPRLTCGDVTKFGQYLASQIQASSKDVSILFVYLITLCFFSFVCLQRGNPDTTYVSQLQELIQLASRGTFDIPFRQNQLIGDFFDDITQASGDHESVRMLCAHARSC